MLVKTKTVSRELNVNPSTIQRWVKHFDLPCGKNDHGHLLFSERNIEQLKDIKKQLNHGLAMDEVQLNEGESMEPENSVSMAKYEKRLDAMVSRINEVDQKLSQKADEVVSIRLYQHRSELDQLSKTVLDVESRLQAIESQLSSLNPPPYGEETVQTKEKPKRNWLVSLFGT
ncbi:MAG TPA: MerR family transcriptional regulator [Bacillales bacterium]|nr:MerR family transcriptional regulator [Bacillales bacterium]